MKDLIKKIDAFKGEQITYEGLGGFVSSLKIKDIQYKEFLPEISPGNYSRNILCLEPFECVLLHWDVDSESAIHHHQDFFGYVVVLQGQCENIEYKLHNDRLTEFKSTLGLKGAIINEQDGVIHMLKNAGQDHLVTLHFYYPALEDLNDLAIYDQHGTYGLLNEYAKTASFLEPHTSFKELKRDAFEFVSFADQKNIRTHRITPVIPKPEKETIEKMLDAYYSEQARNYDSFDLNDASRRKYNDKINEIISEQIKEKGSITEYLSIGCGTGRRPIQIKELSSREYSITGIDLSEEMCKVARERNIDALCGSWPTNDLDERKFDLITFLYGFGHLSTEQNRKDSLENNFNIKR